MLVIPLGLIALIAGFIFFRQNQKAAGELELRRIESRVAEIARLKQAETSGELVPVPARTRRIRLRR